MLGRPRIFVMSGELPFSPEAARREASGWVEVTTARWRSRCCCPPLAAAELLPRAGRGGAEGAEVEGAQKRKSEEDGPSAQSILGASLIESFVAPRARTSSPTAKCRSRPFRLVLIY